MTSEILAAIKDLQAAHAVSETKKSEAAVLVAKVARNLIDALLDNNTLGPDPNNNPNENRSGGGGGD